MKTYTVKNYKGNLVESLKKFSNSYKGMKIVEACEDGDDLKIKAEESKEKIDESEEGVVFSISTISGAKPKRTEAKLKTIGDLRKIWEENGEEELIIDFDEDDGPRIEVYDEALRQL